MAGFTKQSFSMHSRHKVNLCDVELIVKDLMRKQELLRRYDRTLGINKLVGVVKNPRRPVNDDAVELLGALGLDRIEIRAAKTKEAAVKLSLTDWRPIRFWSPAAPSTTCHRKCLPAPSSAA